MDFDDLIANTVHLLQKYPEVREYYQDKFRYVLIDEYQDTNQLQYLLASLLAGRRKNICVVGDDDQSIYRFRGATIENILNFENQYQGCRTIRLEQNYRSKGHILDAANAVIAHNQGRNNIVDDGKQHQQAGHCKAARIGPRIMGQAPDDLAIRNIALKAHGGFLILYQGVSQNQ